MHKQLSLLDLKAAAAWGRQTNSHWLAMHILFFRADHFEGRLPSREPRGNRHVIGFCAWADYQNRNEARRRRWWELRVWGSARVFIGKHISDGTPLMPFATIRNCGFSKWEYITQRLFVAAHLNSNKLAPLLTIHFRSWTKMLSSWPQAALCPLPDFPHLSNWQLND